MLRKGRLDRVHIDAHKFAALEIDLRVVTALE